MCVGLFSVASFTHQKYTRTQIRVVLPKLVAPLQIFFGNNVCLQQSIPLEIRQRFEEDSRAVNYLQPSSDRISLQGIQCVGTPVAMLGLGWGDSRIMRDQS